MPIVEEPRDDFFYDPALWRFSAAAFGVLSAIACAWLFYLVLATDCFSGRCENADDDLAPLLWMVWGVPAAALAIAAFGGLIYLLASAREHTTALGVSVAGVLATAGFGGAAILGLARGM